MPQDSENMKNVRSIIDRIEKERLYRGKGGEVVRGSVCHLINALSTAKVSADSDMKLMLFKTLLENFKHPNQEIQDEAT